MKAVKEVTRHRQVERSPPWRTRIGRLFARDDDAQSPLFAGSRFSAELIRYPVWL
jgi:hypothetical protein